MKVFTVLIVCFISIIIFSYKNYNRLAIRTNIQIVRELYELVSKTPPSNVSEKENDVIIKQRLRCYAEYGEYETRIRKCNNLYAKSIVAQAKSVIMPRPDLGNFVRNLSICPVMHSLCLGKTDNDKEKCIAFERQCIDYVLDEYWRGSAQSTRQQYRNE